MSCPPLRPATLEGAHVRLEPLRAQDADALWEVGGDPDIWRLLTAPVDDAEGMRAHVAQALREQAEGTALPFVTRLAADGRAVGATRFLAYASEHRRVEIGWTWIARPWRRTAVNTEAKLMMLRHAFEALDVQRVELKTDLLNERSQRAMERLGAVREGVLRSHVVTTRGRVRDTVYYSILRAEWPAGERRLAQRLARGP